MDSVWVDVSVGVREREELSVRSKRAHAVRRKVLRGLRARGSFVCAVSDEHYMRFDCGRCWDAGCRWRSIVVNARASEAKV